MLRGEWPAAESRLREDLAADPLDAATLGLLIEVLIAQEKLDEAHDRAVSATVLRPDEAGTWTTLGRVEARRGRDADAVAAFERALALDPVDRRALFYLQHLYEELGEPDRAAAAYRRLEALGGFV
jgi:Flp pilus assembly protein TadD